MSNIDATCDDLEYHKKVIGTYGIVLTYDQIGYEYYEDSFYPEAWGWSDKTRTNAIAELCNTGYEKQFIMSQDVGSKMNE